MQSKGAIRLVAILLGLACLWQLSFTLVGNIQAKKSKAYAEKVVEALKAGDAAFSKVAPKDQAYYLDSVRKDMSRWYLDSISTDKVYLG